MLNSVRDFVTSHNDASKVVRDAQKFSIRVPVVGKIGVPPPRHLAFYTVLGALAVTEVIPWPVAVGVGVGHALTVYASDTPNAPATGDDTATGDGTADNSSATEDDTAEDDTPAGDAPSTQPDQTTETDLTPTPSSP